MIATRGMRPSRSAGFTLVEMLVGLALLALILSFLTPLLFEARRALRLVDRPNVQAQISAAQNYLRSGLSQIYPAVPGIAGDQSRLGLQGNSASFSYATTFAPQSAYQGVYFVTLHAALNGAGGLDLVADEQLYRPATGTAERAPARRVKLVENVASASFAFFASQAAEGEAAWRSAWPSSRAIPELVAVTVAFPAGDGRGWPTLWVRPAAAGASRLQCPARVACD